MEHRIASYVVEVDVRADDEAVKPPSNEDLERVVQVSLENWLAKQHGGVDIGGISVRVESKDA